MDTTKTVEQFLSSVLPTAWVSSLPGANADLEQLLYRFCLFKDYSPATIAPIGQASAHVPQSVHALGSIT